MNDRDEALRALLQRAAPGPADRELKRDLWPKMRQRLKRPSVQSNRTTEPAPRYIPWGDWALAAALILCLFLFPATIPALLYLL